MPKKLTFEYVYNYFKEHGCELLEEEYGNCFQKLRYRCNCKNVSEISFDSFRRGHRCKRCGIRKQAESHRYSYKEIYNYFKERGCELLEKEYYGIHIPLEYRCNCRNISYISFNNFKQGKRCRKCGRNERLTYEYVYNYFKERGCELLEEQYFNNHIKMKYRCECKNIAYISFSNFKQGHRCNKCGTKKMKDKQKLTYEYIYNYFKEHGCTLLEEEYFNNHTLMEYECECGRTGYITFGNFQQGCRCKKCAIEKISGENHPNYNPNLTEEEREKSRICPGIGKWITNTYKRDNYTCQCCNIKDGKLCAHHIENYSSNKELRIEPENGITLCQEHHILFHKIYGRGNNTRAQLEEFLNSENIVVNI